MATERYGWIGEDDWKRVRSWLYSPAVDEMKLGVGRICAWRVRGSLPFPIQATATLCHCLIRLKLETDIEFDDGLCLMMGMAITRFINGLYDYGVQYGKGRGSIQEVVEEYDIPVWLVEARHNSTHRVLPSLLLLKQSVEYCYRWLWNNYWKPNYVESTEDVELECHKAAHVLLSDPLSDTRIRKALNRYRENTKEYKTKLVFKSLGDATHSDFVILLKEYSFLYPVNSGSSPVSNVPVREELSGLPCLDSSVYEYWRPLLDRMIQYKPSVKTTLITALIVVMHDPSVNQTLFVLLGAWLAAFLSNDVTLHHSIERDNVIEGPISWDSVFSILKTNPGYYSYTLMEICLKEMSSEFSASSAKEILHLTALVTISARNEYHTLPHPSAPPTKDMPLQEAGDSNKMLDKLVELTIRNGTRTVSNKECQNGTEDMDQNGAQDRIGVQTEDCCWNECQNNFEESFEKGKHVENMSLDVENKHENETENVHGNVDKGITENEEFLVSTVAVNEVGNGIQSSWRKTTGDWNSIPLGMGVGIIATKECTHDQ